MCAGVHEREAEGFGRREEQRGRERERDGDTLLVRRIGAGVPFSG